MYLVIQNMNFCLLNVEYCYFYFLVSLCLAKSEESKIEKCKAIPKKSTLMMGKIAHPLPYDIMSYEFDGSPKISHPWFFTLFRVNGFCFRNNPFCMQLAVSLQTKYPAFLEGPSSCIKKRVSAKLGGWKKNHIPLYFLWSFVNTNN